MISLSSSKFFFIIYFYEVVSLRARADCVELEFYLWDAELLGDREGCCDC